MTTSALNDTYCTEVWNKVCGWNAAARKYGGLELTRANYQSHRQACEECAGEMGITRQELETFMARHLA